MIKKFKLFESNSREIKKGDIVSERSDGMIGLVISDRYYDKEYGDYNYDVYYRSMNGTILEECEEDIELCNNIEFSDLSAYVSIAKDENIIINIPEEYKDRYPKEYQEYNKNKKRNNFKL